MFFDVPVEYLMTKPTVTKMRATDSLINGKSRKALLYTLLVYIRVSRTSVLTYEFFGIDVFHSLHS